MKAVILLAAMASIATAGSGHDSVAVPECKPAGGLLFEIDQRGDPADKLFTATAKLYGNGSWSTDVYETDGKLARTVSGCFNSVRVDSIRDTLQGAKWAVSPRDVSCRAAATRKTVYKWNGRVLYTDRTCNSDVLDRDSKQTLDWLACLLGVPEGLDEVPEERLPISRATRPCRGLMGSR